MASSALLPSPLSSATTIKNRELSYASSAFLPNSRLLLISKPRKGVVRRCGLKPVARKSLDHIPKQFREENLADGLKDNYNNVPECLYGLTPGQMEMFMTENSPIFRQSEEVTPETLSAEYNYVKNSGMPTLSSLKGKEHARFSAKISMIRGGRRGGFRRPRRPPPDLASMLVDCRILYLGLPIVAAVSELLMAEMMFFEYDDPVKPIYFVINSTGTKNDQNEIVGSETDAYMIADCVLQCRAPVYTINLGKAYGQAAMLLSLGKKGKRGLQPRSSTRMYLPGTYRSSGVVMDMYIKAKDLNAMSDYYVSLLARGIGKPKEQIREDIRSGRFFSPQEAIEYGIADKIVGPDFKLVDNEGYQEMLARSRAERRSRAPRGLQAASPGSGGFR